MQSPNITPKENLAPRFATGSTQVKRPVWAFLRKRLFFSLVFAGLAQGAVAGESPSLSARPLSESLRENANRLTAPGTPPITAQLPKRANFGQTLASPESRELANWIVDSGDNVALPFVVVDKVQAQVFVFDAHGRLLGATAALLGLAVGDDTVPGIGTRKLSSILPAERTTPAGRFVAALDRNLHGEEILWVDYDSAISLHRVVTAQPKERRAQRLASPTALDKRITYGCINVPAKFYGDVVSPAFTGTDGIVYVLPETRPAREVFGSYDVDRHARDRTAAQALPTPPAAGSH